MSGGSYDYAFCKIDELADSLENRAANPHRESFYKLLKLVSKAAHDIEWVDSCDKSPGDEIEAIEKCFAFCKADPKTIAKAHAYDAMIATLKSITGVCT